MAVEIEASAPAARARPAGLTGRAPRSARSRPTTGSR